MSISKFLALVVAVGVISCGAPKKKKDEMKNQPVAPLAKKVPVTTTLHGVERTDPYFWLRDKENPEVIQYLKDENAYTKAMTEHYAPLTEALFKEMRERIKETDQSPPYKDGEYFYYRRTVEGLNYPIHCRKKGSMDGTEEILLDENELAKGHEYFEIGILDTSPDHKILAYSVDTKGNERYTLKFKNLETGEHFSEEVADTYYSFAWANDNKTVYYDRVDHANRPFKVFRHTLGQDPNKDQAIFHEADERFFLGISKTRSDQYIFLEIGSQVTTEVHVLDANDPAAVPQLFAPRKQNEEYYAYHQGDSFFILTNDSAQNFKLMRTSTGKTERKHWEEVVPHRPDVMLVDIDTFQNFLVVHERFEGIPRIEVRDTTSGEKHFIEFPEPVYAADSGTNVEYDTQTFRLRYTSLVTPLSTFDYDMKSKARTLVKQKEVFGYDPTEYTSERVMATSHDGTKVPISIVYKRSAGEKKPMTFLLAGYGSYGSTYDPGFRTNRVSLLDRGVGFAWAHVRGGADLGRSWYDNGKFLKKKNTFKDFIACAEHLINAGYTTSGQLAISGGSAGGLLMGAVVNERPELFRAVVADVPFVDVLNTMLDDTLPLTVIEWEEWGNPKEKEFFDYMASYSPYDNVKAQDYPAMLITAGLNDPRVGYWEPAKWAAKLRATKTDGNILLLKTNMGAGHGGASGRYDYLKEIAFEYAFILDQLGKN